MIRRRADVRKAERHVCRFAMGDELNRNQTLIMIWRNHDIELTGVGSIIQTVRGVRARHRDPFGGTLPNRRREDIDIFATEHAAFARVRVDRRHCQPLRPKLRMDEPNKANVVIC